MALKLGKRKRASSRDHASSSRSSSEGSHEAIADYQDIFRRHFEARFQPLQKETRQTSTKNGKPDDEEPGDRLQESQSDWSGFSSGDDDEAPAVYHENLPQHERPSKSESKSFMDARPPSSTVKATSVNPTQSKRIEGDREEQLNLQNDLALHRLISESHLLENDSRPPSSNRQKVTAVRLKSLGAKKSLLEQRNMPMSHRKGIASKAREREDRRRLEAKENGIILEKAAMQSKTVDRRLRGVGGAAVGQFKGGTLNLGKRDIASIIGKKR